MHEVLAAAVALVLGYGSALVPVINAEAAALAGGAITSVPGALLVSFALAVGQTGGKVTIMYAIRAGRRRAPAPPDPESVGRWRRAGLRMLGWLDRRPTAVLVVLLSASLGIPPLLIIAGLAGAAKVKVADFVICCLVGRWVRFAAFALPVAFAAR